MTSKPKPRRRAVAYVRMSTGLQQYSPDNQMAVIERYAAENDMEIVATYSDEARSGLRYENRPGMQKMLADAQIKESGFDTILVYDVNPLGPVSGSRRGRVPRVCLQEGQRPGPLLRGAVHQRRQPDIDGDQGLQTLHGGRIQPKSLRKSVRRPVPAHRARLPPRGHGGVRAAPHAHRPEPRAPRDSRPGPAQPRLALFLFRCPLSL